MKETIKHTCPHCKHEFNIDIYPVINLQSDTEIYNDLFSLDLFRIECEQCKKITLITYNTLVVDMYKKYIIYLTSDTSKEIEKLNVMNNYKDIISDLKYTRSVNSLNELAEKLYIFDYDLNDKIIEYLKYGLKNNSTLEADKYTDIRFNKLEKEELIFTCFNMEDSTVNPKDIAVNIKYYNEAIDEFKYNNTKVFFEQVNQEFIEKELNK
jgi:hypothetical protein